MTPRTTRDEAAAVEDLRAIVAAVLETDPERITPDAGFHEQLEMDSLQKTEFVARVERAFGSRFLLEEAAGMDSLTDVLTALRRQGFVTDARTGRGVSR
jgi:acyl carrier protein